MVSVENYNLNFPKYPITIEDKGWIYGVWYCGTSFQKVTLHGQYPPTFLKRALSLFPMAKNILHCPSGQLSGHGITMDMVQDKIRKPMVIASADNLPFKENSFDLVLSDPPYTKKDSAIYGCPPFPLNKMIKEVKRVLRPGGHLGMLHTYYPSYRRKDWRLIALIAVVTGFCRATRIFSILENL